jgi:hypothetical protein
LFELSSADVLFRARLFEKCKPVEASWQGHATRFVM